MSIPRVTGEAQKNGFRDAAPSDPAIRQQWRTSVIVVIASLLVTIGLFWGTAWSMVATWYRSLTYSHGFLILPCSVYLIWACRHRVASVQPKPSPWALSLLPMLGFGWLLGDLAAAHVVKQFALVGMLVTIVWAVVGTSATCRMLFPLLFLFFAVPMGAELIPPMQDLTAFFAVKGLDLSGIPVVLEGRLIFTPSGTWRITEACSGIRYFIASVVLGCLYAYLVYRTWGRRVRFVLVSAVVPILANGVRAFGIILLGHLSNQRIAVGVDHVIYGWLFSGFVTALIFSVGWWWRERPPFGPGQIEPSLAPQGARPTGWPLYRRSRFLANPGALFGAAGVALLTLAPLSSHVLSNRGASPLSIYIAAPIPMPPWKPTDVYTGQWRPQIPGADTDLFQTYAANSQRVDLYLAYSAGKQKGDHLVGSMNAPFEEKRWVLLEEGGATAVVDGQSIPVRETIARSSDVRRVLWSWYWVGGKFTCSPYRAKLLQAKTRLVGGMQGSALIAVGADYAPDRASAVSALQDFLRHMSLGALLSCPSTREALQCGSSAIH